MIKAFTAFTGEVDDVGAAVAEITEQLDDRGGLLKNSVGLLSCYSDFVESGVLKALCDALPFDVVGSTTLGSVVGNSEGRILLTLMVLTSDDAEFGTGLTEPITSPDELPLKRAYGEAAAKISGAPKLMISFAPLLVNVSGDYYVDTLSGISGGIPNFGMIAVDNNIDYRDAMTIHRGEAYRDRYSFVLIGGSIHPRFFIASISSERVFMEKGIVTESRGNQLMSVNNKPVVEYLQSVGLKKNQDGSITGVNSFPFVVDYNDGTSPVVRVIFAMTPEGYAVCGGDIPNGAALSVGHIDGDEVVSTTREILSDVLSSCEPDCLLLFSCCGRYFSLDHQRAAEMELVQELMGKTDIPYIFMYSGGELCPVGSSGDPRVMMNRNHNDTLVMCAL